jgi:hypothetical protein
MSTKTARASQSVLCLVLKSGISLRNIGVCRRHSEGTASLNLTYTSMRIVLDL